MPSAGSKDTVLMAISSGPSFNYTSHKKDAVAGYTLYAFIDNAEATAEHTFFNGQPAYLLDQTTQPKCFGDAAGRGGGVKSGTIGGEVKPTSGSSTIFIEGKALIREGDTCTMNNGNVKGKYVTVDAAYAAQIMAQWADQSTEQALADGGFWAGTGGPIAAELWQKFLDIPSETAKNLKETRDKFLRNSKNYAKFFKGDFNAGMLTAARDIAEDYKGDFAYFEGGVNIGGIETFGTISINVHNGKVYIPSIANAGIKSDSKPSLGGVVGVGWILDAPEGLTDANAMDRGLGGKGSYTGVAYGSGSTTYSQTDDGSVSMVSVDVGKTVGGSKDKMFGFTSGSTKMEQLDLSKQKIKYDRNKKKYIYNDDKGFSIK